MKPEKQLLADKNKIRDLFLSLLFDTIGMMSFTLPFIGEFADVIWAPLSGLIMVWMYKGIMGKIGGVVTFLEEILPATDFIPSFTLMWFYTYFIKKKARIINSSFFLWVIKIPFSYFESFVWQKG